ncbi:MAG: hypothetical protein QM641_06510 [Microbacterium sp.]
MDAAESADEPGGSKTADAADPDAHLLSALEVIEQQPLAERAAAYAALHDELARRLESGPTTSRE